MGRTLAFLFLCRVCTTYSKQLDGGLSAVSSDQADDDKVDASDLNVVDMGAFVYVAEE